MTPDSLMAVAELRAVSFFFCFFKRTFQQKDGRVEIHLLLMDVVKSILNNALRSRVSGFQFLKKANHKMFGISNLAAFITKSIFTDFLF